MSPDTREKIGQMKPKRKTITVFNGELLVAGLEEFERRLKAVNPEAKA